MDEPNPYEPPHESLSGADRRLSPIGRQRQFAGIGAGWGALVGGRIGLWLGVEGLLLGGALGGAVGALVGYNVALRTGSTGRAGPPK